MSKETKRLFSQRKSTTKRKTRFRIPDKDFKKLKDSGGLFLKNYWNLGNAKVNLLDKSCELVITISNNNMEINPLESEILDYVCNLIQPKTFKDKTSAKLTDKQIRGKGPFVEKKEEYSFSKAMNPDSETECSDEESLDSVAD